MQAIYYAAPMNSAGGQHLKNRSGFASSRYGSWKIGQTLAIKQDRRIKYHLLHRTTHFLLPVGLLPSDIVDVLLDWT